MAFRLAKQEHCLSGILFHRFESLLMGSSDTKSMWVEPVRNHFWHCAETCKGDADSLKMSFIYLLTFIFTGRIQL